MNFTNHACAFSVLSLSLSSATFCLLGRRRQAQLDLLTISIILHLVQLFIIYVWFWSKYLWLSLVYEVLALNQSKKTCILLVLVCFF